MDKYQLWICVEGRDEDDEERIIYEGNNREAMINTMIKNNDEVVYSLGKYFYLVTPELQATFESYEEFMEYFAKRV